MQSDGNIASFFKPKYEVYEVEYKANLEKDTDYKYLDSMSKENKIKRFLKAEKEEDWDTILYLLSNEISDFKDLGYLSYKHIYQYYQTQWRKEINDYKLLKESVNLNTNEYLFIYNNIEIAQLFKFDKFGKIYFLKPYEIFSNKYKEILNNSNHYAYLDKISNKEKTEKYIRAEVEKDWNTILYLLADNITQFKGLPLDLNYKNIYKDYQYKWENKSINKDNFTKSENGYNEYIIAYEKSNEQDLIKFDENKLIHYLNKSPINLNEFVYNDISEELLKRGDGYFEHGNFTYAENLDLDLPIRKGALFLVDWEKKEGVIIANNQFELLQYKDYKELPFDNDLYSFANKDYMVKLITTSTTTEQTPDGPYSSITHYTGILLVSYRGSERQYNVEGKL